MYSFEPLFRSLELMKPEYNCDSVAIVSDRNGLRKLLNFAYGHIDENFRIDFCMVRTTLFLIRREMSASLLIKGSRNSGYGHNFECEFTEAAEDLENSSGHHRIINYKIGVLNCVVRFEVDACLGTTIGSDNFTTKTLNVAESIPQEEPSTLFNQLSLSDPSHKILES